jgi:PhzF family phenazine biosynthesis protein
MVIPIFHVDAFTNRPFAGNPAAVCILSGPRDDNWLQAVAGEMNLSETAFLTKEGGGYRMSPAFRVQAKDQRVVY